MNDEPILRVSGLCKRYRHYDRPGDRLLEMLSGGLLSRHRVISALNDLSFTVQRGEAFGIVGRSGSGKTTLVSLLSGLLIPTSGTIVRPVLTTNLVKPGTGFEPDLTVRQNIARVVRLVDPQGDTPERRQWISDFCEFDRRLDQPLRALSARMHALLGFAVAISATPDLLILDEIVAPGDRIFRKKCQERIARLQANGTTVILASHNLREISRLCTRAMLLEHGTCAFIGSVAEVVARYEAQHDQSDDDDQPSHGSAAHADDDLSDGDGDRDDGSGEDQEEPSPSPVTGDGRAALIRAEVLDRNGRPCVEFPCGGELDLRLEFSAHQQLAIPVVGWQLIDHGGTVICGTSTHLHDPPGWPHTLAAGARLHVGFRIRLPLHSGQYRLGISLGDLSAQAFASRGDTSTISHALQPVVVIDQLATVRVVTDPDRKPTPLSHLGLVDVPCTISCSTSS